MVYNGKRLKIRQQISRRKEEEWPEGYIVALRSFYKLINTLDSQRLFTDNAIANLEAAYKLFERSWADLLDEDYEVDHLLTASMYLLRQLNRMNYHAGEGMNKLDTPMFFSDKTTEAYNKV